MNDEVAVVTDLSSPVSTNEVDSDGFKLLDEDCSYTLY
jgi:hypothetical protein